LIQARFQKILEQIADCPRRKSLRDPEIALSGRVNEGERKLGTKRVSWWTRAEGVEGRAKKGGEGGWRKKNGGKKDVGFESGRILESNQNEVRSHEPYI